MNKVVLVCLGVLAASTLPACGPDRAAPAPAIHSFGPDLATVKAGQAAALRWDVRGAAKVAISPDVGPVSAQGSIAVAPGVTTAYTLVATDAQGRSAQAALTVNVTQAAGPPTPYPILFVTQVPLHTDVAARLSAFANHLGAAAT